MTEPILHHFEVSPFSEKIRLVLGAKRMAWRSVRIPPMLPKPDLVALTGGYRKTPVLQIGADVYCDTALICDVLEHLQPEPTLYPEGRKGLARTVAQWADTALFWTAVAGPRPDANQWGGGGPETAEAFLADRRAMFDGMQRLPAPDAAAAHKSYLRRLSEMVHTQPHLLGEAPCIADFAAYHPLWFSRVRSPAEADLLLHTPALAVWFDRMAAIGHGQRSEMTAAEALDAAAACEPLPPGAGHLVDSTFQDEHGIALGSQVTVAAESFGREPTQGRLMAATRTHYTLARESARTGRVHVHFPRIGCVLRAA